MLIHESNYINFANQELDWLTQDTKERFESNYKDDQNRKKLEKLGWIDNKFRYKFNSNGFRCNEFTTRNSIVFLGCSFTLGIGLPVDNTFASILSTRLGLDCYNLSMGGGSCDTAFRMARYWIHFIKPKIVISMATFKERYEIKIKDNFLNRGAWVSDQPDNNFVKWASEEDNMILNKQKNLLAIECICLHEKVKFINLGIHKDFINYNDSSARDLAHPGIESNRLTAEHILNKHML